MSEELIVTIIDGFFTYAQMLLLILLIGVLQDNKSTLKKRKNMMLLLIPVTITLFLAAQWVTPNADIRLTSRIINLSLFYYTMYYYTGNFTKTICLYGLITITTTPLGLLVNWLFEIVNDLDIAYVQLCIGVVISLEYIALLFVFTKDKWDVYREYINVFSSKIKYILYIYFLFEITAIITMCIQDLDPESFVNIASFYILPIFIVFLVTIFIQIIKRLKDNSAHLETEVMTLKYYTKTVEELYTDMRNYKHDINNVLLSMKYHITNRDIESLEKFYEEKVEGFKGINLDLYHLIAKLDLLKIDELKGLILSKYQWAKHLEVTIETFIVDDINRVSMDIVDLCRVVGIVLDNAIEAASEAENSYVLITIEKNENGCLINITNSYHKKNRANLFAKIETSTKGAGRGVGLKSLHRILGKYSSASLNTNICKEEYTQQIIIK